MTAAEAALRQLLADVEAARACRAMSPLAECPSRFMRYLEKLARDGLAVPPAREDLSHLMGCGGTLPCAGLDYIGGDPPRYWCSKYCGRVKAGS